MTASSARACMADFTAALLERNIEAALDLLADDALLFFGNGVIVRKAGFAATMTSAWNVIENYAYATSGLDWLIESETAAVAVYGFHWSGLARGQAVGGSGRATRAFVDRGAGWLLAHEHLSAGEAPA